MRCHAAAGLYRVVSHVFGGLFYGSVTHITGRLALTIVQVGRTHAPLLHRPTSSLPLSSSSCLFVCLRVLSLFCKALDFETNICVPPIVDFCPDYRDYHSTLKKKKKNDACYLGQRHFAVDVWPSNK